MNSQVFHSTAENKYQDFVEGPSLAQMEEETTDRLKARAVGVPSTVMSQSPSSRRRKGNMSIIYGGRAALKREQCDIC
jgi:hypothetical protein